MPMSGLVNYEQFKENIADWPELGLKEQFEKEGLTTPKQQEQFFDVFEKALKEKSRGLKKQTPTISTEDIQKAMDAGYIMRSAEGGIAGLKHGGAIAGGHQIGTPIGNRTGFGNPFGYEDAPAPEPSHGDVAHGPGGRFDVANQPTQTTTTFTEAPPGEEGGPGYISPKDLQTLEIKDLLGRQEAEKTEDWEKSEEAPWNKKTNWLKTLGTMAAIYTGVAPILGIKTPTVIKLAADANTLYKNIDRTVKLGNKIFGTNYETDKILASIKNNALEYQKKKALYDSLPAGHPEKIALSVELEIGKKPPTAARDNGGTQETGITYDDIEDTNRKERASAEARQIQEKVDRSKQDAYYAAFRQQYLMGPSAMAAEGGRIPGGYNTGGLSNLFRLKNI